MKKTDVIIIGAGPAGIFTAYEVSKLCPDLKILLLDKGKDIYNRSCPQQQLGLYKCAHCKRCSIMEGFGGAGAFSDGKYNITTEFGGWLSEIVKDDKAVLELIEYVDMVNVSFGAPNEYSTSNDALDRLEADAQKADLKVLRAKVKHIGTEVNLQVLKAMYEFLKEKVSVRMNTNVTKFIQTEDGYIVSLEDGTMLESKYLVVAPGRRGAKWFADVCTNLSIPLLVNRVDVGVRVEVLASVCKKYTDEVYEVKVTSRENRHGDRVRTFCMNPNGVVALERVDDIITVNGHSYQDKALGTENTNFALLVTNHFKSPFIDGYAYSRAIAKASNMLNGGVTVQRFEDLLRGKATVEGFEKTNTVKPTLKAATPGDLEFIIPMRQLEDIIDMLKQLDKIMPGIAGPDTLLYGIEVKFYCSRPEMSEKLEIINYPNFFAPGDGSGTTRGLAQAAAAGVYVAREICQREKNS
ncbi:MAG: FAD-dependent oxidoreductase [Clostridia bacterium]